MDPPWNVIWSLLGDWGPDHGIASGRGYYFRSGGGGKRVYIRW